MRNLFLILLLANIFLFAWQQWVNPATAPPLRAGEDKTPSLALFGSQSRPSASRPAGIGPAPTPGGCARIGPFQDSAAAEQVAKALEAREIAVTPYAREGQVWLGHWVQIGGFPNVEAAEEARHKLAAGGLSDAYLMQEGADHLVSLGVFREQARADRVAAAARQLGFEPVSTDRYRPGAEQWLLAQPRPGATITLEDLKLADARILRSEATPCGAGPPAAP